MPSKISHKDLDLYANIKSGDLIVQEGWGYLYDVWDDPRPDPDLSVRPEWIGKRAKDCCYGWNYFVAPKKPIPVTTNEILPWEEK